MIAVAEQDQTTTLMIVSDWVTAKCSNRDCCSVLFRYQPPPDADTRRYVRVAVTCPNRRCHKAQEVRIPAGVVVES